MAVHLNYLVEQLYTNYSRIDIPKNIYYLGPTVKIYHINNWKNKYF